MPSGIYKRTKKHKQAIKQAMNNRNWNYNGGYHAIHRWLAKKFGKANKCENNNCLKRSKVFEWALLKGKKVEYKKDNFIQLCKSCHIKYDFTEEGKKRISKAHLGKKETAESIQKRIKANTGKKRSDDFKKMMSRIKMGKPCIASRKKCFQYNLDNKFIKEWESLTKASNFYKIKISNITLCCQNKQKTAKGFIWKYKKQYDK